MNRLVRKWPLFLVMLLVFSATALSCGDGQPDGMPTDGKPGDTQELELVGPDEQFYVGFPVGKAPEMPPVFELQADMPVVEDTMVIYRVVGPVVTSEKVRELGRKLGFKEDATLTEHETAIELLDQRNGDMWHLSFDVGSGCVLYDVIGKLYPPEPPTLPSNDEAKEIAESFLSAAGLLPPQVQFVKVIPGGSYGGEQGEYVTHLLVCFTREIDGFPVTGNGAKFSVRIGDGGEVLQLFWVWREVEPYKLAIIKSPEEAFQDLMAGRGSYYVPRECEKVVVEEVFLAYWMEAAPEKQEYVVPVYEFKGKCVDKDGQYLEDFTYAFCHAIENVVGPN